MPPNGAFNDRTEENTSGQKYFRRIPANESGLSDIHAVCDAFDVSHAVGHAVKKLLMAGQRGTKDYNQDLREAMDCIHRELSFMDSHAAKIEEQMDHA